MKCAWRKYFLVDEKNQQLIKKSPKIKNSEKKAHIDSFEYLIQLFCPSSAKRMKIYTFSGFYVDSAFNYEWRFSCANIIFYYFQTII